MASPVIILSLRHTVTAASSLTCQVRHPSPGVTLPGRCRRTATTASAGLGRVRVRAASGSRSPAAATARHPSVPAPALCRGLPSAPRRGAAPARSGRGGWSMPRSRPARSTSLIGPSTCSPELPTNATRVSATAVPTMLKAWPYDMSNETATSSEIRQPNSMGSDSCGSGPLGGSFDRGFTLRRVAAAKQRVERTERPSPATHMMLPLDGGPWVVLLGRVHGLGVVAAVPDCGGGLLPWRGGRLPSRVPDRGASQAPSLCTSQRPGRCAHRRWCRRAWAPAGRRAARCECLRHRW